MEALFISTGIVALAEIGDKTQLLAFILAARFKKPIPIIFGILIATLFNHGLAGALGALIEGMISPLYLRYILGISFIAMATWILMPDKIDDDEAQIGGKFGVFLTTLIAFFMAEMGDKTQIATVAMAAKFNATILVVFGTTLGMMIANVPAVYLGEKLADKIPLKLVHGICAFIFAVLGVLTLLGMAEKFGL